MPLRHPLGDLPLPTIVDALVRRVRSHEDEWRDGWERVHQMLRPLPDADPILAHLAFGDPVPDPMELHYTKHPFEVVPLFWNGGDALHYGFAWYDAAVEPIGASYAPSDDGAVWLGDDPSDAVRNLIACYAHIESVDFEWADEHRTAGLALGAALGLDVSARPPLTRGARSDREVRPRLPEGWHFVEDGDGIGTAAPRDAFGPELPDHGWDDEAWLESGRRALFSGYPGSALAAFRAAYRTSVGGVPAARAMADAYRALGREPLAARAEVYIRMHDG